MIDDEKRQQYKLLEDSARRFLEKNYKFDKRSQHIGKEPGFSYSHWQQMTELGWMELSIGTEYNGLGGGADLMAALMKQFGRFLYLNPYFASVVVSSRLLERMAAEPIKKSVLSEIAAGSSVVTPALYEKQSRYDLSNIATTAIRSGDKYVLNGSKVGVQYGNAATHLTVLARTAGNQTDSEGLSLFFIPTGEKGVEFQHYTTHDGGRVSTVGLNEVTIDGDRLMGAEHQALPALQLALNYATAVLCAEVTGAMEVLFEQTLEYVKTRTQFGQKIGSFQAIQHRMVDMYMRCELANSMCQEAVRVVDELDSPQQDLIVSAAKAEIGRMAVLNAEEAVHLHGAMGMMNEMPVGHYFKRIFSLNLLYGDPAYHQTRYRDLSCHHSSLS